MKSVEPISSLSAEEVRQEVVRRKVWSVIELYEQEIRKAMASSMHNGTYVVCNMKCIKEIVRSGELHSEVMESVARAFEAKGFRVQRESGSLVYFGQRLISQPTMSISIHW